MTKRMLIDATHPEETRVVALNGNKLDEFDFETESKKQLKGNIYLAKVTRVEPSLQAAFVEYGGNRHGFLPFSEIHPDYYRIPISDRQAMLAQAKQNSDGPGDNGDAVDATTGSHVETVGGDEAEEVQHPHPRPVGSYKIQEVIKRRQILLVQVAKEERGTKGAALTTFISLAGRYTVLMPNNATGGGVSRKITNVKDRKRLRKVLEGLHVPDGMSLILRTAGMERTKAEIKRDYDYLLRLWDSIRERTLNSVAPTLIYEEANLIKRAIRDLYTRDIEEVLVEGEDGYRTAKDFMRMLMPSHAKKVQPYRDQTVPLFHRYQVEQQIENILSPTVTLKSGGSIVLNPTEALVAIDVNSGKATKERHIEETAVKTNLEAAEEIARQLRLRDLAGLIVIDFIDMESDKNNHAVEKRLKEAMKSDRARVQLGKISPFGLLELSRQRLRPSLMEISFEPSPDCGGTGYVRTVESSALHVLRGIEDEGIRGRSAEITVHLPSEVALYILNQKRDKLANIEQRYGLRVQIDRDETLYRPSYRLERERAKAEPGAAAAQQAVSVDSETPPDLNEIEAPAKGAAKAKTGGRAAAKGNGRAAAATADATESKETEKAAEGSEARKRRRSRGGRRRRKSAGDGDGAESGGTAASEGAAAEAAADPGSAESDDSSSESSAARRRRGKRGGRRRARLRDGDGDGEAQAGSGDDAATTAAAQAGPSQEPASAADTHGGSAEPGGPAEAAQASQDASAAADATAAAPDEPDTAARDTASAAEATETGGTGKAGRSRRRTPQRRSRRKTASKAESPDGDGATAEAAASSEASAAGEPAAASDDASDAAARAAEAARAAAQAEQSPAGEDEGASSASAADNTPSAAGADRPSPAAAQAAAEAETAAVTADQPAQAEPAAPDRAAGQAAADSGGGESGGREAVNVPEPVLVDEVPAKRRGGWWRRRSR